MVLPGVSCSHPGPPPGIHLRDPVVAVVVEAYLPYGSTRMKSPTTPAGIHRRGPEEPGEADPTDEQENPRE